MILDLKGKGTVFLLPVAYSYSGTIYHELYEVGLLLTLGIRGGIGVLSAESLERIREANGRMRFNFSPDGAPRILPIAVAFRDEAVPRSIYEVPLNMLEDHFPSAEFIELDIEFTDAPVTSVLSKRLPWLRKGGQTRFDRLPPGQGRSEVATPLGFKMSEDFFFAKESR